MVKTLFIAVALLTAVEIHAAELHLRRSCPCTRSLVSLGEVAEIYAVDEAEAQRLAKIELFPAPPAGSSRLIRAGDVRDVLARRGVDLRQIRLLGASSTWLQGGATASEVAQASAVAAPPAAMPALPTVSSTAVVSLRPLRRGEVIRASDVQLQSRDGEAAAGVAVEIDEVIGKQLLRPVTQGGAIAVADLQSPLLVQKNEVVTVYARTRGVQVRTSAKALESGARGDVIALESLLDRNAHFTARVIGTKEVEVLAGAPLVSTPAPVVSAPVVAMPAASTPNRQRPSLFGLRVREVDATSSAH
jgi:flagella basal body P-ring formation protein FlgA